MARLITQYSALASGAAMVALVATFAGGCSSGPETAGTTSPEQAAMFERVKSLAGEWTMPDETGKVVTASVYTVTSAGTAVREVMFPGTPHEMTNMYHMDGDTLLMTHFCAMGNQPHMRASVGRGPNELRFDFDGVTNLRAADEMYMGSMTMTIVDQDHVVETWNHYKSGVKGEPTVIELTRKH